MQIKILIAMQHLQAQSILLIQAKLPMKVRKYEQASIQNYLLN